MRKLVLQMGVSLDGLSVLDGRVLLVEYRPTGKDIPRA